MDGGLTESETEKTELLGVVAAIRFLALSGCRLGEALLLCWDFVDFETGGFSLPDARAGARVHPVGAQALALLAAIPRVEDSPWIFHGANPAKR